MRDIERLSSKDESEATEAFDRLNSGIRECLSVYFRGRISHKQDLEDIIIATCIRIWKSRLAFKAVNERSWVRHIRLNGQWCAVDLFRKRLPEVSQDLDTLDYIAQRIDENASNDDGAELSNLADEAWLGWKPTMSPRDRSDRVFAAQSFYLEDRTWENIASVVKLRLDQRNVFDQWLGELPTLMHMAFLQMYCTNNVLCEFLLDGPHEYSTKWSDVQRFIIRVRFGHPHREPDDYRKLPTELVKETIDICKKLMPFCARAKRIKDKVLPFGQGAEVMISENLWKRVIFQYMAKNRFLEYESYLERVQLVAVESGATMTYNTVQAGVGNHRLANYLRKYREKRGQ